MRKQTLFTEDELQDISIILKGMSEKEARLYLGRIANRKGHGAISVLALHCHVSRGRISRGKKEVLSGAIYKNGDRNRQPGGGRWDIGKKHRHEMEKAGLSADEMELALDIYKLVEDIVDAWAYGDPMSSGKWINTTAAQVRDEVFARTGKKYGHATIKKIIRGLDYSFQKNKKYDQAGERHPMRNDQFLHIAAMREEFEKTGDPIVSLDAKAKVKLGNFFQPGYELRKKKNPRKVNDHDFAVRFCDIYPNGSVIIPEELMKNLAIVTPYGIYDVIRNTGFVVFGISHDTSEFAVEALIRWWEEYGSRVYRGSTRILILCDGGGDNKAAGFLWKEAIQQFADITGLEVTVCHYPPGTSKYNPIERRLWSQVTRTWAAKPLLSLEHAVKYAQNTSTKTGLAVSAEILPTIYYNSAQKKQMLKEGIEPYGIIDTKELQEDVMIERYGIEGEIDPALRKWNYTIRPHSPEKRWKNYRKPCVAA